MKTFLALLALTSTIANASPQHFKKVMLIVLENTNYDEALKQPYLSQLISKGVLFTDFLAESHPSQPNYIAMISGSTQGVSTDGQATIDARHLGDLLEAKGLSWKTYAEDYPGGCFLSKTSGNYARKHVPFLSFKNIQENADRCAKHVVKATDLDSDIQAGALPDFSFYVPNLKNDGHDTGAAFADKWLQTAFSPRLADKKFSSDMLFVVTFDESESLFGSNHIFTLFVGDGVVSGTKIAETYNHYSVLKMIEDEFGLGNLGQGDASASKINGVWRNP